MNFNNLCKFYILQYSRIRNHKLWRKFLLTEYDFYLLKRRRQKLGDVKFEIKQTYFDKYLISTNFEMVFSRQPGARKERDQLQRKLDFFTWKWDFKNVLTLCIFAILFYQFFKLGVNLLLEIWFIEIPGIVNWDDFIYDYLAISTKSTPWSSRDLALMQSQIVDLVLLASKK